MRKILSIMAGVLVFISLGAQSTSPAVLSSAGGHGESGSTSVDWTLGEMSVTTLSSGSNKLTQGFHQPGLISVSTEDDFADITLSLYPNPTEDVLNLIYSGDEVYDFVLHGLAGQLLSQGQIVSGTTNISMYELPSGHYILNVLQDDELKKTFKIEKTGF